MSQNPLDGIRRRQVRARRTFPDARYASLVLEPQANWVAEHLAEHLRDIWIAHAILLAERRSIEADVAAATLARLTSVGLVETSGPASLRHATAGFELFVAEFGDGALRLGIAPDEVGATALRMYVRGRALALFDAALSVREALAAVAGRHLNTLLVLTSNGQSSQPSSLGHYLTAQLGPFARTGRRLREAWARLNLSPVGAVAGASTAVPLRRERGAELLGFSAVLENTLDAIAASDWIEELAAIVAAFGTLLTGILTDMRHWARDDVGVAAPDDGYVHAALGQPQRFDPRVLEALHTHATAATTLPTQLAPLLGNRQMLGSEPTRITAVEQLAGRLDDLCDTLTLFADTLEHLEVNRSMFATRTHRGFSSSSELAELLAIDFHVPLNQAYLIAERVVAEALQQALDATTVRTDLVDRVALEVIGREIGIEPEMLSRCLSPKRFIERRAVLGGPAPSAVTASLERETFAVRQERAWSRDTRAALETARAALLARAAELIAAGNPTTAE